MKILWILLLAVSILGLTSAEGADTLFSVTWPQEMFRIQGMPGGKVWGQETSIYYFFHAEVITSELVYQFVVFDEHGRYLDYTQGRFLQHSTEKGKYNVDIELSQDYINKLFLSTTGSSVEVKLYLAAMSDSSVYPIKVLPGLAVRFRFRERLGEVIRYTACITDQCAAIPTESSDWIYTWFVREKQSINGPPRIRGGVSHE